MSVTVAVTLFPPFTVAGESVIVLMVVEVVVVVEDELELDEPHAVRHASDRTSKLLVRKRLTRTIHPSDTRGLDQTFQL